MKEENIIKTIRINEIFNKTVKICGVTFPVYEKEKIEKRVEDINMVIKNRLEDCINVNKELITLNIYSTGGMLFLTRKKEKEILNEKKEKSKKLKEMIKKSKELLNKEKSNIEEELKNTKNNEIITKCSLFFNKKYRELEQQLRQIQQEQVQNFKK